MLTIEMKHVNSGMEFFHYLKKISSGAKSAENFLLIAPKLRQTV
jgi:hypothetical protein